MPLSVSKTGNAQSRKVADSQRRQESDRKRNSIFGEVDIS
jgi:hypothetical protein